MGIGEPFVTNPASVALPEPSWAQPAYADQTPLSEQFGWTQPQAHFPGDDLGWGAANYHDDGMAMIDPGFF